MLVGGMLLVSAAVALTCCLGAGAFESLAWLWVLPLGFFGCFLLLALLAFLFLAAVCAGVDMKKEQQEDSAFFRCIAYLYIDAIITLLRVRVHTRGMEKLPREGRFLLVCNHQHAIDPAILLSCCKKSKLAFISKRENDKLPIAGPVLRKISCQSLDRNNDRDALKTILKCIQLIKDDQVSVAVFPEGYTHKDEKLHPFRNGVFKIAQRAQVPVVVCTIQGTRRVLPAAAKLRASHVQLHLVGVIPPEEYRGMTTAQLGDMVYEMMAADLGKENT